MHNLRRLNQDEVNNLSRSITTNVIEAVIKNPPSKKIPGPDEYKTEFCQNFKEELTPIFLKLFYKTENEGTLANYFCEASTTPIPEPDYHRTATNKNYRSISDKQRHTNSH